MTLLEEMRELESAEESPGFFSVAYDPDRVKVIRLHLLKRFGACKKVIDTQFPNATEGVMADRPFPESGRHCSTCGGR